MSVAGILAGNFLSGVGAQYAQQTPFTSSAPSSFAAVQQKLSQSGAIASPGASSVSSELSQLGRDLKSGNLSAAEADYSALKIALAQRHARVSGQAQSASAAGGDSGSQAGSSGTTSQSGTITDPSTAAMLAYSSLQNYATAGELSASLMTPASTFSIDA